MPELFVLAAAVCATLTFLVIKVVGRAGLVAEIRSDRWHRTPVALHGGVAFILTLLGLAAIPGISLPISVLVGAAIATAVGLIDDVIQLSAGWKLLGQTLAGVVLSFAIVESPAGLTAAWWITALACALGTVAAINVVNLIDNMDGVAAAIVGAVAVSLTLLGQVSDVGAAAILGGVAVGFLFFNFPPAKIFMGDSGSHFLGYILSYLALSAAFSASHIIVGIGVYVAILAVPLVDAAFVTVVRLATGRRLSQGGMHHLSHRLAISGFSNRMIVLLVSALSIGFGLLTALAESLPSMFLVVLVLGVLLILHLDILLLIQTGFLPGRDGDSVDLDVKRKVAQFARRIEPFPLLFVDLSIWSVAFSVPAILHRQPSELGILDSILIVAGCLTAVLLAYRLGIYRILVAEIVGTPELARMLIASLGGTAAFAILVGVFQSPLFRAELVIMAFCLSFMGTVYVRTAYRIMVHLGSISRGAAENSKQIILFGAGEMGAVIARYLRRTPALGLSPVGFVDDNPTKTGRRLYGIPVWGSLASALGDQANAEIWGILVTSDKLDDERVSQIASTCWKRGLECRRFVISMQNPACLEASQSRPQMDLVE